ncbi:hypothetical protein XMD579_002150 [Marinobacterium sp. xm-d-579]|uniref:hypothetical protein n=1 Tax=Marinobacterium sp. xm-d-579 TaxID=2497734 RepID=UPI001568E100|nr:hypothetical protein [Marinobacterium sp. xm-d-579]NRP37309.1 hypothetical protein [Marinobacterium sp. xm-d-579]
MKIVFLLLCSAFVSTSSLAGSINNYFCSMDGFSTSADPEKYVDHITSNLAKQFLVKVSLDSITVSQVSNTSLKYSETYKIFERWHGTVKAMNIRADSAYLFLIEEKMREDKFFASMSLIKSNVVNGWEMTCDKLD